MGHSAEELRIGCESRDAMITTLAVCAVADALFDISLARTQDRRCLVCPRQVVLAVSVGAAKVNLFVVVVVVLLLCTASGLRGESNHEGQEHVGVPFFDGDIKDRFVGQSVPFEELFCGGAQSEIEQTRSIVGHLVACHLQPVTDRLEGLGESLSVGVMGSLGELRSRSMLN
jgi:hypothetical protein